MGNVRKQNNMFWSLPVMAEHKHICMFSKITQSDPYLEICFSNILFCAVHPPASEEPESEGRWQSDLDCSHWGSPRASGEMVPWRLHHWALSWLPHLADGQRLHTCHCWGLPRRQRYLQVRCHQCWGDNHHRVPSGSGTWVASVWCVYILSLLDMVKIKILFSVFLLMFKFLI